MKPRAWLVVAADGHEMVFLDRARAEAWAARCSGILHPLYTAAP